MTPVERTRIDVTNEGTGYEPQYVAHWDGQRATSPTPFGLDSALDSIGAPNPRDLHLIGETP